MVLIYASYEKSNGFQYSCKEFFVKDSKGIPNAYCLFNSFHLCGLISGYFNLCNFEFKDFLFWIFTQITFFNFLIENFIKGYGVGSLNGSLWTISVEIQFYLLTPIVYLFLKKYA